MATAQNKTQKEIMNNNNVRAFAFPHKIGAKPEQVPEVQGAEESGYAFAERTMRKPTKAMARALRIGDVIEAFYQDDVNPVQHIVIEPCESDGDIYDVRTVTKSSWESGKKDRGPTSMNTEYWRKLGRMAFNFKAE